MLNIATVFSGIGSIEYTLKKWILNIIQYSHVTMENVN